MMTSPEEYRQSAAECLQAAKLALRDDVKATLLAMAQLKQPLSPARTGTTMKQTSERLQHLPHGQGLAVYLMGVLREAGFECELLQNTLH